MSTKKRVCDCAKAFPPPQGIVGVFQGPKPVQDMTGGEINLEVLRCIEDIGAAEIEIGIHEAAIAELRVSILRNRQWENQLHNERRRREIDAEQR